jgi:hypothetical protein
MIPVHETGTVYKRRIAMKKITALSFTLAMMFILSSGFAIGKFKTDIIDKVRLSDTEIPEGFMLGQIPGPAKVVFKGNPWLMDRNAIQKLTQHIYPGGDYTKVSQIHVTILANREKPFSDDIVCYVILYNDTIAAKDELRKFQEFVGYNSDRAILLPKDNLAVFLLVDDVKDFHYIQAMAGTIEGRLRDQ